MSNKQNDHFEEAKKESDWWASKMNKKPVCDEPGCLVNHFDDFVMEYIFKPDEGIKTIYDRDVVYNYKNERIGIIRANKIVKGMAQKDEQEENAEYIKRAKDWIFDNGKLTGAEGKDFIKYVFNN